MSTLVAPLSLRNLSEVERGALRTKLEDAFAVQSTTLCKGGAPCTVRQVNALWDDCTATISMRYQRVTVVENTRDEERLLKAMGGLYDRTSSFEFAGSMINARINCAIADLERPADIDYGVAYTVTARLVVSYQLHRVRPTVGGCALSSEVTG